MKDKHWEDVCALDKQGKGRWIVEIVFAEQIISNPEHRDRVALFAHEIETGKVAPICACCTHGWTSMYDTTIGALFIATPCGALSPMDFLICGVCTDCCRSKDLRKESKEWLRMLYGSQMTAEAIDSRWGSS
jgi:hypothetical protein